MAHEIRKELNHTYLTFEIGQGKTVEDYRVLMLLHNEIAGILRPELRSLDRKDFLYYDITDKETILDYTKTHTISYEELLNILKSLMQTSNRLQECLLEEDLISMNPEFVFRNIITGEYSFVCSFDEKAYRDEETVSFFQFLLTFVDTSDEKAVSSIYGIYAIIVDQVPRYQSLYDSLWEPKQKEEEISEEQKLQIEDDPSAKRRYHFSKSEFVALGSMAAGVLFLLARVYLSFVV